MSFAGAFGQGPCQPQWASAPPGEGRALTMYDHGAGPVLYIGTAGSAGSNAVAAWDGTRLRHGCGGPCPADCDASGTLTTGLRLLPDEVRRRLPVGLLAAGYWLLARGKR